MIGPRIIDEGSATLLAQGSQFMPLMIEANDDGTITNDAYGKGPVIGDRRGYTPAHNYHHLNIKP